MSDRENRTLSFPLVGGKMSEAGGARQLTEPGLAASRPEPSASSTTASAGTGISKKSFSRTFSSFTFKLTRRCESSTDGTQMVVSGWQLHQMPRRQSFGLERVPPSSADRPQGKRTDVVQVSCSPGLRSGLGLLEMCSTKAGLLFRSLKGFCHSQIRHLFTIRFEIWTWFRPRIPQSVSDTLYLLAVLTMFRCSS